MIRKVSVVASFDTANGQSIEIVDSPTNGWVEVTIGGSYHEFCHDDIDTFVSLLTAYRDGFEFPPKPVDPTVDTTSAFKDEGDSNEQCKESELKAHYAHNWREPSQIGRGIALLQCSSLKPGMKA